MNERIFLFEASVENQNRVEYSPNSTYPLGLTYLDAILKKEKYQVITKDYALFGEEDCLRDIKEVVLKFKPAFVGISVMSMTRVSS